ncbi:MAG: IS66 family transposase [Acidobacteriota bacterium]
MDPTLELPPDIDSLKALVVTHLETIEHQSETIARLEHNNQILRKLVFGKKSEKRPPVGQAALQESLFFQELAAEASRLAQQRGVAATVEVAAHTRVKKGRRSTFPEHLPVVRTVSELKPDERICACGGELKEFGEEVSRELERLETTVVHEMARKKYACSSCKEGVVTAPWRGKVIDKGLLGPGFLSHVIVERFGNHMPYFRLEGKYRDEGLELSRSVLCVSMARCAELLEPIAEQLREEILASPVVNTDDTPVTLAQSSKGGSRQARVWAYLNQQGRHWYDFTENRRRDGPARVFGDFTGYIQADAYSGYDRLFLPGGATEVGCWFHARRGFIKAETTDPVLAKEAIDRIRELFRIEQAAAHLSDEDRARFRQEKAGPLLEELRAWLDVTQTTVLPKSPMGQAITYIKNQWVALTQYLKDGRLEMTNNAAERAVKPFAIGRKNWLFFQREGGGKTASILMSLLMTAKAAGIPPGDYFKDVLLRISEPGTDVKSLTPHGWKERFEPEVTARRHEILKKLVGAA